MFGSAAGGFSSGLDLFYLKNYALTLCVGALACLPCWKTLYGRLNPRLKSVLTPVLLAAALLLSTAYLVDGSYNPFLYFIF